MTKAINPSSTVFESIESLLRSGFDNPINFSQDAALGNGRGLRTLARSLIVLKALREVVGAHGDSEQQQALIDALSFDSFASAYRQGLEMAQANNDVWPESFHRLKAYIEILPGSRLAIKNIMAGNPVTPHTIEQHDNIVSHLKWAIEKIKGEAK